MVKSRASLAMLAFPNKYISVLLHVEIPKKELISSPKFFLKQSSKII